MFLLALSLVLLVDLSMESCIEKRSIGLLDCSYLSMKSIDGLTVKKWVVVVDFRHNHFTTINITKLVQIYPNVRVVDLRENPHLDCQVVRKTKIVVKSDCNFTLLSTTTEKMRQKSTSLLGMLNTTTFIAYITAVERATALITSSLLPSKTNVITTIAALPSPGTTAIKLATPVIFRKVTSASKHVKYTFNTATSMAILTTSVCVPSSSSFHLHSTPTPRMTTLAFLTRVPSTSSLNLPDVLNATASITPIITVKKKHSF